MKPQKATSFNKTENPVSAMYGDMESVRLTRAEAGAATFEERLASVARFVVGAAHKFYCTLSAEGRITYSLDDIFMELWIELKEKDGLYDAAEGSYLSYCNKLIHHKILDLRECSRVVRMPMNVCCDFRRYDAAAAKGCLTPAQRALMLRILAAGHDHDPLTLVCGGTNNINEPVVESDGPLEALAREEHEEATTAALAARMYTLTTMECVALGASLELWGQPRETARQLGVRYSHSDKFMRAVLRSARQKLGIKA